MTYKNEAYDKATREGLFSTDGLPTFMRVEIERYETAIVNLMRVAEALAFPFFTDNQFVAVERAFAEDAICDMVCAVRDLHERRRVEIGSVARTRHDALRGLEAA